MEIEKFRVQSSNSSTCQPRNIKDQTVFRGVDPSLTKTTKTTTTIIQKSGSTSFRSTYGLMHGRNDIVGRVGQVERVDTSTLDEGWAVAMPWSGSEPWFGPDLDRTGPILGSRFKICPGPDRSSGSRFVGLGLCVERVLNRSEPEPNVRGHCVSGNLRFFIISPLVASRSSI